MTVPASVLAMASVARALGPHRERVVFIGGAVAPLLQTHAPFPRVRPTDDVDAVVASASYTEAGELEAAMRELGFKHGGIGKHTHRAHHAHRWYAPDGTPFDLVPQGEHLSASGNKWDEVPIRTAVRSTITDGIEIRHVSAPGFLVLKWAAYVDRGRDYPMGSDDLEDILALLASRPTILDEIAASPDDIKQYLRASASELITHADFADLLDAHLNNAQHRVDVVAEVRRSLGAISSG